MLRRTVAAPSKKPAPKPTRGKPDWTSYADAEIKSGETAAPTHKARAQGRANASRIAPDVVPARKPGEKPKPAGTQAAVRGMVGRGARVAAKVPVAKPAALKQKDKPAPLNFKLPKKIAEVADLAYQLRAERLALQKKVDEIQEKETLCVEHLISNLPASSATGTAGRVARASINTETRARPVDWAKIHAYIIKTKSFDLLQRRLNEAAVAERWDDKKTIPGVEAVIIKKVSLTKI